MIELSSESAKALKSILKDCQNSGVFISEKGVFRAVNDSRAVIAQGCLAQNFQAATHYEGYLVNKSGDREDHDENALRFLKPSGRNSFFNVTISDLVSNIEAKSEKKSYFVLGAELYQFFENGKVGLPGFSFDLRTTDEHLDFSIIIDDAARYASCKDQVIIHNFEGPECSIRLLGPRGILNGIKRLKNEDFFVTVFHGGAILLESNMRELTVLQSAKIMH